MAQWEEKLNENRTRYVDDLMALLRIPSISALPEHAADVQAAAAWVAARLQQAGIENARVMPTGGHPVVYGEWLGAPGKQTVLVYGHFDVQPVDPLDLWTSPPFKPTLQDERLYARGASDSKGNVLIAIAAIEALLQGTGALPVNVKVLFEGQEEIGSPQLAAFVAENKELLACDVVVNSDSLQWSQTEPALLVGLRGLCAAEIEVRGAQSDLHSGLYGGAVANPLHALAELLASMHAPDGTITVEGFYDDVVQLSAEERAQLAAVPFDEATYKGEIGVESLFGEPNYTTYEQVWVRPTLEVVGMWGGFQGAGVKTVLPREAHAKITCRLVPNQNPHRVLDAIEKHVEAHKPGGVTVTFRRRPSLAFPYLMPADHSANQAARDVLVEMYGREPYWTRMGGTIPVAAVFLEQLNAYLVSFGFGLPDEQFHAPNEFFRLASFQKGQMAFGKLLERLGQE